MRFSGVTVCGVALLLAAACGEEGAQDDVGTTRAPLDEVESSAIDEVAAPSAARTVDGDAADWFTRATPFDNMGIVARDAQQRGEHIFIDAAGDHRTDLGATAPVDLRRIAFTADDDNLYALVVLAGTFGAQIPQVQITVDIDRVTSSGQTFTVGFSDTAVVGFAAWERLIQTRFAQSPAGSGARVLDTSFAEIAGATAVLGATGTIEIGVPWAALGLSGPPQAPLRFTVSSYLSSNASDDTASVGDATVSNALDSMGDCRDPRQSMFPNAFACDLNDGDIDFYADVYFAPNGAVYSPLLVSRFVANAGLAETLEWVELRNVSPVPVSLDQVKMGDEETPDSAAQEGMALLPSTTILAPGAAFTIAADGAAYQGRYGVLPDAEFSTTSAAPTVAPFFAWYNLSAGAFALSNTGDQILVLDLSNTILDVANYLTGTFVGVTPFAGSLTTDDEILVRSPATQDTDNNAVDFVRGQCAVDAACNDNNPCTDDTCVQSLCVHTNNTAPCLDADVCDGNEVCSGGTCGGGTPLACGDTNPCTDDSCDAILGCQHAHNTAPCPDGDLCNGNEICAGGTCGAGTPLACADTNPCTDDSCDAVLGCQHANNTAPCPDGTVCNGNEVCSGGACGAGTPLACGDGNPCTDDSCDPALGCQHMNNTLPCDDGLYCNGTATCAGGACVAGSPPVCPDGNLCNGAETCDERSKSCAPGTPVTCSPLDECHLAGTCNPLNGVCSNPAAGDGTPCRGGTCVSGSCVPSGGGAGGGAGVGGGGAAAGAGMGGAGAGAGAGAGGAGAGAGGAGAGAGGAGAGAGGAGAGAGGAGAGAGGAGAGAGGAGAGAGGASAGAGGAGAGAGGAGAGAGGAAAGAGGASAGAGGASAGAGGASAGAGGGGAGAGAGGAGAGGASGGSTGGSAGDGGAAGADGGEGGDGIGGDDGVGGSGAVGGAGRSGAGGAATGGTAGVGALAGEGGEAGAEGDSGGGSDADESGGCGCAVPGSAGRRFSPALVFALIALGAARRRTRARRAARE